MTEFEKLNSMKSGTITFDTSPKKEKPVAKKNRHMGLKIFAGVLSLALMFSLGFGVNELFRLVSKPNSSISVSKIPEVSLQATAIPNTADNSIVSIVKEVGPSVVNITTKVQVRDFFNNLYYTDGAGSGVVIGQDSETLFVMTNAHVVNNAKELLVTFSDGNEVMATIKGVDSETDLAVIQISKKEIPPQTTIKIASLGDSDALQVGETAIAIGNALGYNNTVTVGVISALNRELKVDSSRTFTLIQTDAAINPGNSGGALVNIQGQVIGINTVKITQNDVEGFGFSIPSNSAKPIIDSLLQKGYVERPYLGISGVDITEMKSELYDLPIGIYVAEVEENSSADVAGIQPKDILVSFNGKTIFTMTDLKTELGTLNVGDQVEIKLIRNNEKISMTVTLQNRTQPIS